MAINFFSINGAGGGGGGGSVTTNNGISGTGTAGDPIILGVNPLTEDTTIDVSGHLFEIIDGGSDTFFVVQPNQINLAVNSGIASPFILMQNNQLQLNGTDGVNVNTSLLIGIDGGTAKLSVTMLWVDIPSGNFKSIEMSNRSGIEVHDEVDNIGLIGVADFTNTAEPLQYVQRAALPQKAAIDSAGQSTTQTLLTYAPPADAIIRVNAYAQFQAGTGNVKISVDYTDIEGNAQTVSFPGQTDPITTSSQLASMVIKAKGGTDVDVNYTVVGSINYAAGATIENLFD